MMDALKELIAQPEDAKEPAQFPTAIKRAIGFITPQDRPQVKAIKSSPRAKSAAPGKTLGRVKIKARR
jgi:hypothetical protein